MICVRCNTDNLASAKFCRSCGAALGTVCPHCGTVSHPDDQYCTSCGLDLAKALSGGAAASHRPGAAIPVAEQYTPEEIAELLALRKTVKKEETSAKTLSQDDVDKLFG